MEWVETTGPSVEEAKEQALDQLGVDEQDAEFEVLEEPRPGLFGRKRGEARVRARVAPTQPRPKRERRDRRRRDDKPPGGNGTGEAATTPSPAPSAAPPAPDSTPDGGDREDQPTVDEQAAVVYGFLEGLVAAFGYEGTVESEKIDDDTVEVTVLGDDLGLLIGPKGQTLVAVHELARTVVQRQSEIPPAGRVRVDIGGYRRHRREALERFTRTVAEQVRDGGSQKALEPMGAADRKVVHDTVNTIDGVTTLSEGQEPRRRVVILPD